MRFLYACFFIISVFTLQAREVATMREVMDYFKDANEETLILFDVDMVLIQPNEPAFQMANMKRHKALFRKVINDMPEEKRDLFLNLVNVNTESMLLDPETPQALRNLSSRKIPTMALTANFTGSLAHIHNVPLWKIGRLSQFGIDFTQSAPYASDMALSDLPSFRGNHSLFTHGILFVNGIEKGPALISFLKKISYVPKKIIFIDDREANLTSVERALKEYNPEIVYMPVHFVGASNYPSRIVDEEEFETRWQEIAKQALVTS